MTLTAGEQYLLELINRARLDPVGEAGRYNLGLNDGLAPGTIGTQALQVLAPDAQLEAAASAHSTWMLQANQFSHSGQNETSAGDRIEATGYRFQGSWGWRENLAWLGSTASIDMGRAIELHHAGLYRSENHRASTFDSSMQQIGIAQVAGKFTYEGITYNSSMLTENFAMSGSAAYVTGVAYRDGDQDNFYSMGEGQQNYWVMADGDIDRTAEAGGYAVAVDLQDDLTVSIGRGDQLMARVRMDLTDGNVKLDLVTKVNGTRMLEVSGDTTLVSGVANARLLGSGDLELTGSGVANKLVGNVGHNRMEGAGGNDLMHGMVGADVMLGGSGNDRLFGGWGYDRLFGGDGWDLLVGGPGNDAVFGGAGNDRLLGGSGNDRLFGDWGYDRLFGGDGWDLLVGGPGNDAVFGGAGNDRLLGGSGNDRLFGGYGNDRLDGGYGNDRLIGGAGADMFIFSAHSDVVMDFQDNVDTIAIHSYLGDGDLSVDAVLGMGEIRGGNVVFDFGYNHVLTINNVDNLSILANDMIII